MPKKQENTSNWTIEYTLSALKELKKLPKDVRRRIYNKIDESLLKNPYAGEPLEGRLEGFFKFRVGDYRVIYELKKERIVILILRVAHRKDAYRFPL